jgi:dTDP-4-dehydrorhamnose 3,5-epimerase
VFEDARGFFMETYKTSEFKDAGIEAVFVQDNHARSLKKGVLRGMHYQLPPYAQSKLVRVTAGSIFDVAVDMRRSSPSFGKWVGAELSAKNKQMLFIPAGFAHGYCTLEDATEVQYKCTAEYAMQADRSLRWNDPHIGIQWPNPHPILSGKDEQAPLLSDIRELF